MSLSAVFWTTTAVALLLAHAIRLGDQALYQACVYTGFVVLSGMLLGGVSGDWKNAFFWGALYALLAYLAVAGGHLTQASIGIGWGLVGAFVGGLEGVQLIPNRFWGTVASILSAMLAMVLVIAVMRESFSGLAQFDVLCAGVVGFLLRPFTTLLLWYERESKQPRLLLVAWLATSVLVGNFLVPILGGVQR